MFSPLISRLQARCQPLAPTPVSRRWLQLAPVLLARSLPALGSVLYESMCLGGGELPCGLLVESAWLAPLLQGGRVAAASTITIEGPREWIECLDDDNRCRARLHLLPDTDYLAWDGMLDRAALCSTPISIPVSPTHRPVAAQLLRFHLRPLAGLELLGSEGVARVSPLSRQLVEEIVPADTRAWRRQRSG